MQEGRRSAEWDHTAALIAQLRAVHGDKTARFEKFHPYLENAAALRRKFKQAVKQAREQKQ